MFLPSRINICFATNCYAIFQISTNGRLCQCDRDNIASRIKKFLCIFDREKQIIFVDILQAFQDQITQAMSTNP
jgi:hypothetical protein